MKFMFNDEDFKEVINFLNLCMKQLSLAERAAVLAQARASSEETIYWNILQRHLCNDETRHRASYILQDKGLG
jgi:hypothetical protein